jgi:F-type H+-transporting ATPase subunit b
MTIDWWTLGIQAVNVLILVWLLQRFFWRPVAAMIAQRKATAQTTLADAQAQHSQAVDALADIARTRAGFAKEHEAILAASHADAEQARTARLDQATQEATALEAAAKSAIEAEKQAAGKAWAERSGDLAIDIARRLAARLDGPAVRAAFLDWLVQAIRALPEPTRNALTSQDVALEAISATPLDPAEQAHAGKLIDMAFGAHLKISFKTDPALIAGLELHAPHLAVSNSWRADLTKIQANVAHA